MTRILISCLLAFACVSSVAAPTAAPVRAEIDALLTKLELSGCQFNRNGSWYSGAEAKVHLLNKLDYLEGKTLLQSSEQFIEQAASSSSVSGSPYQVRCAGGAPVQSHQWLTNALAAVRAAGSKGKP
jgi:hypothetical protein